MGTNLQLRFPGLQILGGGCSHRDDSNQLGIFHLQPLLEVPQELGEAFMAAFFLEPMCLWERTARPMHHQRGHSLRAPHPGASSEAEGEDGDAQR